MYTPNLGVWMQRDPAEEGLNLYENVESNPVNLTDPTGLYVTARLQENHIMMEVGITLWSPWERKKSEPIMTNIESNIHRGLQLLEQANPFTVCHMKSQKVYPVRWSANVKKSFENHFLSKPDNAHYVEVRSNPSFLGLFGEENSFSPSITTQNDRGGWGVWSYVMGANVSDDNAWWAAHEVMHFAGLWDQYNWLNPKEVNSGYEDNIMGRWNQWNLKPWQMESMLKDRLKADLGWTINVDYKIIK